jgi:hypothetical protein
MPISVTCQCGARLDIDEKFLGKEIPCPDCQRPLPTKAPVVPPPLDLPDYRRTSGLAVLSLTLALVGAFTIVGTLAAIVVGVFALRELSSKSGKLDGIGYARAGIIVGAVFTFITLAALISPTVLGLDTLLRDLAYASRIQYSGSKTVDTRRNNDVNITLNVPPGKWGIYLQPETLPNNLVNDDLILINVHEDAFIGVQTLLLDGGEDDDEKQKKVLERFYRSELVNLMGRLRRKTLGREGTIVKQEPVDGNQEITLDLQLGGLPRRFLIQYPAKDRDRVTILVGAARASDYERLQKVFRDTFKSKS